MGVQKLSFFILVAMITLLVVESRRTGTSSGSRSSGSRSSSSRTSSSRSSRSTTPSTYSGSRSGTSRSSRSGSSRTSRSGYSGGYGTDTHHTTVIIDGTTGYGYGGYGGGYAYGYDTYAYQPTVYNNYGYNNYGYNNYRGNTYYYSGLVVIPGPDGTYYQGYGQQCPSGCAVAGRCGTKEECSPSLGVFGWIFLSIFFLCFFGIAGIICCAFCGAFS